MTQSTNASQTITIQPTGADGVAFQINATNGSNVINVNTQSNTLNVTNNGAGIVTNFVEVPIEIITGPTVLSPFGISVIDGYTGSYNVTLPTGPTGSTKIISLLNGAGYEVTISTAQGSLYVDPAVPNRTLYAFNNPISSPWVIQSDNNASFFPNKLQQNLATTGGVVYNTELSADGNLVVYALATTGPTNASISTWTRANGVWTNTSTFSVSPGKPSVALSDDASTLAVGDPGTGTTNGNVYIYTQTSGPWVLQQTLNTTDSIGNSAFGASVALSADGNNVVAGGPLDNGNIGAAWTFNRSAGVWSQVSWSWLCWYSTTGRFSRHFS
jgi:hypothetical protein